MQAPITHTCADSKPITDPLTRAATEEVNTHTACAKFNRKAPKSTKGHFRASRPHPRGSRSLVKLCAPIIIASNAAWYQAFADLLTDFT